MTEQRGYISNSEFVPSPNGRYTRDDETGKVTDSRGGNTSGASYDIKDTSYNGESFESLATGSNLMSSEPTIRRVGGGYEDSLRKQSYMATSEQVRREENRRKADRIIQNRNRAVIESFESLATGSNSMSSEPTIRRVGGGYEDSLRKQSYMATSEQVRREENRRVAEKILLYKPKSGFDRFRVEFERDSPDKKVINNIINGVIKVNNFSYKQIKNLVDKIPKGLKDYPVFNQRNIPSKLTFGDIISFGTSQGKMISDIGINAISQGVNKPVTSIVLFGKSAFDTGKAVVFDTKNVVKETVSQLNPINWKKTIVDLESEALINPYGVTGSFYAFGKIVKGVSRVRPSIVNVEKYALKGKYGGKSVYSLNIFNKSVLAGIPKERFIRVRNVGKVKNLEVVDINKFLKTDFIKDKKFSRDVAYDLEDIKSRLDFKEINEKQAIQDIQNLTKEFNQSIKLKGSGRFMKVPKNINFFKLPKNAEVVKVKRGSKGFTKIGGFDYEIKFFGKGITRRLSTRDKSFTPMAQPLEKGTGNIFDKIYMFKRGESSRLSFYLESAKKLKNFKGDAVKGKIFFNLKPFENNLRVGKIRLFSDLIDAYVGGKGGEFFGSVLNKGFKKKYQYTSIGDLDINFSKRSVERISGDIKDLEPFLKRIDKRFEVNLKENTISFNKEKVLESKSGINQKSLGLDDVAPDKIRGLNMLYYKTRRFGSGRAIGSGDQYVRRVSASSMLSGKVNLKEFKSFGEGGILGKITKDNPRGIKDVAYTLTELRGNLANLKASNNPLNRLKYYRLKNYPEKIFKTFNKAQQKDILLKIQSFSKVNPVSDKVFFEKSPKIIKKSEIKSLSSIKLLRLEQRMNSGDIKREFYKDSPITRRRFSLSPRVKLSPRSIVPLSNINKSLSPKVSKISSKNISRSQSKSLSPIISLSPYISISPSKYNSPSRSLSKSPNRSKSPYLSKSSSRVNKNIYSKVKNNKRLVRKIRRILSKIPSVYRPSFEAVVFGIVGKRPKYITGIELRPIIRKLVNRKKRLLRRKSFRKRKIYK